MLTSKTDAPFYDRPMPRFLIALAIGLLSFGWTLFIDLRWDEMAFLTSDGALARALFLWDVPLHHPELLRLLSLLTLVAAALGFGRLLERAMGDVAGPAAGRMASLLVLLGPMVVPFLLDVASLPLLFSLTICAYSTASLLRSQDTLQAELKHPRLQFAMRAIGFAFVGSTGLWALAIPIVLIASFPYRHRSAGTFQNRLRGALAAVIALSLGLLLPAIEPITVSTHAGIASLWVIPMVLLPFLIGLPLACLLRQALGARSQRFAIFLCTLTTFGAYALVVVLNGLIEHPTVRSDQGLGTAVVLMVLAYYAACAIAVASSLGSRRARVSATVLITIFCGVQISCNVLQAMASVKALTWQANTVSQIQDLVTGQPSAQQDMDTEFLVLGGPSKIGWRDSPRHLGAALKPPFSKTTIVATYFSYYKKQDLIDMLKERQAEGVFRAQAIQLLRLGQDISKPIAVNGMGRTGWPKDAPLDQVTSSPGSLITKSSGVSTMSFQFRPPLPAHVFTGLEIPVAISGHTSEVILHFGDPLSPSSRTVELDLDLPAVSETAQRSRVELAFPATLDLLTGPPLRAVDFVVYPDVLLGLDPIKRVRPLTQLTSPSLLQPAPGALLNFSANQPRPALHAYLDPSLPRPNHFSLHMDLETPHGLESLVAKGKVPQAAGGEMHLLPTTLNFDDKDSGTTPNPWIDSPSSQITKRLSELLIDQDSPGQATIWLSFTGPGGLDLGTTPKQLATFLAEPLDPR